MASVAGADAGKLAKPFRIEPARHWTEVGVRELWSYRELFGFLVWRDFKTRYAQSVLGPAWAVIKPFLSMVIFSVIFGHLAGIQPEYNVPYPLFVFTALLPWTYFSTALGVTGLSVVTNLNLVTKVYIPRLLLPLAAVFVPVIDFVLGFVVLIGMFLYYGRLPHWHAIASPFFLGMALLTVLGVGLWLSALGVRYRDVPQAVPFLTQIWLYGSPVIYGVSIFPAKYQWIVALNPMTGVIDGFRWSVLGRGVPHYHLYFISLGVGIFLTLTGLAYFKHVERKFADVI